MSDTRRKATEDDSQLIEAFSRLETMEIGGFVGIDQVMDPQIKPLDPTMHMAGRALTVRGAMINKGVLDVVQPGDVLVIDTGGDYTTGVWGHLMTMAIRDKGATGGGRGRGSLSFEPSQKTRIPGLCQNREFLCRGIPNRRRHECARAMRRR